MSRYFDIEFRFDIQFWPDTDYLITYDSLLPRVYNIILISLTLT